MKSFKGIVLVSFFAFIGTWSWAQTAAKWDFKTADTVDELKMLGATEEASILLDDLVELFPEWPRPRLQRAGLRLLQGDTKGALVDLDWLSEIRLPTDLKALVNDRIAEARDLRRGPSLTASFFLKPTTNANDGIRATMTESSAQTLVVAEESKAQFGLQVGGQVGAGYGFLTSRSAALSLDLGTHFFGTANTPDWTAEFLFKPFGIVGLEADVTDCLRLSQSLMLSFVSDDDFVVYSPSLDAEVSLLFQSSERISVGALLGAQHVRYDVSDTSQSLSVSPSLQLQLHDHWALGLSAGVNYEMRAMAPHLSGDGWFVGSSSSLTLTPALRVDLQGHYERFRANDIFIGYLEGEQSNRLSGSLALLHPRMLGDQLGLGLRYTYARAFSNISIRERETHSLALFSTF